MNYKDTLNLPAKIISMKANLVSNEPKILKKWEEDKIYLKLREAREGAPKYVLHDGPPYANGNIHVGTAMNKVLKDVVIKYKSMRGYDAPYVPGWDTHGLPIEHKASVELGDKIKDMSRLEIRKTCASYARKYVNVQRKQFKRLGVFGEWDKPYLTMNPKYERGIYEVFADAVEKGMVYRENKPVMWCPHCHTALAEAEVEYQDDTSKAIYVKFAFKDEKDEYVIIWTTTPWTLPANRAVALNPNIEYSKVKVNDETWVMASALVDQVMKKAKVEDWKTIDTLKGSELELKTLIDPIYGQPRPIVMADYVLTDTGTGAVHTAPGHGADDYQTGKRYNLEIFSPVDDYGNYVEDLPKYAGMSVFKANDVIVNDLKKSDALVAEEMFTHSYPHCWRCHGPLIFRSTEQWFISIDKDNFREKTLKAIDDVQWVPTWGKNRISSMVSDRPDWCISRQRDWGMPIPAFKCANCGKVIMDAEIVRHVAKIVGEKGGNIWFSAKPEELLPEGYKCPECEGTHFEKLYDVMDVWIDSGSSFESVLKPKDWYPADLYLEGSDQHRGWFQSSLLLGMIKDGVPPYKTVVTHGFIRDEKDRKMSKSLGNVIDPNNVVSKMGADVFRLWVASTEYKNDVKVSMGILEKQVDGYRKVRNVLRFIFGNIADFDPKNDRVRDLLEIDEYAMNILRKLVENVTKYYDEFDLHKVYHAIFDFITVDMSAFYLDILKDRLYTSGKASKERRSAQTVLYEIGMALLKMMAPIIPFTTEEIYTALPFGKLESIHLEMWPDLGEINTNVIKKWERIREVRDVVLKALEDERQAGHIGHPLEAAVTLKVDKENYDILKTLSNEELADIFIVSKVVLSGEIGDVEVKVEHAPGQKCERCWKYSESVGEDPQHPTLCKRCVAVLKSEDVKP